MNWHPQADQLLLDGNYSQVSQFYEELIEGEPETRSHYWYLGLAYLLQGEEEQATLTWLLVMSQAEEENGEEWKEELVNILEREAQRQQTLENYPLSWLIRGQIREIDPSLFNNLLQLILLSMRLNCYHPQILEDWQIIEILREIKVKKVDSNLLLEVLGQVLEFPSVFSLELAKVSQNYLAETEFMALLKSVAIKMAYKNFKAVYAADLTQICLEKQPDNLALLDQAFWFNFMAKRYDQSIKIAEKIENNYESLTLKVYGQYQILHALIHDGNWFSAQEIAVKYTESLRKMIETPSEGLDPLIKNCLQGMATPLLYLEDNPTENRWLHNQLSRLFQENLSIKFPDSGINKTPPDVSRPLRIGYISHTLRRHSVGWLSRWLLHYQDKNKFSIFLYLVNQLEDEITEKWFRNNADVTYNLPHKPEAIAHQIQADKIDILLDLDSITHAITCQVMALKPAPIQVTWLGMDATGIPTIDYFIADPYVLPAKAQEYYQEKIWRLPTTYLAVDGFEVGIVTLRREHLEIPDNATIYLSSQSGLKRHPNTIRLQMKILKEVPKSYFLIQGLGDEVKIKQLFEKIAEEEGVSTDRLRFLGKDTTEEMHRANLQIADIVLDTYPYNGATTTLEVLWMGIPIVTRVGEQFAARNSYTFMMNAGISEGIAWSDEEYIDWGIRFGIDENLRKQVTWKLRKSKQTAPLWNAKAFTQEMEKAYQQMWEIYCQSQKV